MQARLATAVLLGFVLVGAAACSGGDDGLSMAEEEALQERLEQAEREAAEAERAQQEAERAQREAEQEAADAAQAEREAEAARQAELEAARRAAEEAQRRAQEQIEQERQRAQQQGNINLRAEPVRTKLAAVVAASELEATVTYAPGRQKVFRPNRTLDRGAAPSISGWSGASFTGKTGTTSELAYLYTDIGSPAKRAFWKVYGKDVVSTDTDWATADAKPSSFGNDRYLYQDADGNQDDQDSVSRGGTYDGASGTFTCDSSCNIQAGADGTLTFTGIWTFTASTSGLRAGVGDSLQDAAYLYFGIWDQEPLEASDTSATNRDFDYIAGGGAAPITDLSGFGANDTATFEGGAVGRYVINRPGQDARIGTFTAKTVLNATSLGNAPMIQGRISDFREDGSALGDDWTVFLGGTANAPASFASGSVADGAIASARIDGIATTTGAWDADLYGTLNPGYSDFYETGETAGTGQVKCPASACPAADLAGVAGWFNASHTTAAAIAGAFAAKHTGE